jgi:hypothetical protein
VTVLDEQEKRAEETPLEENKRLRALVLNYEVSHSILTILYKTHIYNMSDCVVLDIQTRACETS